MSAVEAFAAQRYALRLYICGMTPRSSRALETVRSLCERELQGRYELQVIDIYEQPQLAAADQIIAVPTLVRRSPAPLRRFIGDLSDASGLRRCLGLAEEP